MSQTARRVLYVDDQVPRATLGAGFPRAAQIVRALAGCSARVTLYAMQPVMPSAGEGERFPSNVETVAGAGPMALRALLDSRSGDFDLLWVGRPNNLAEFHRLQFAAPALLDRLRIVYDAEAIYAARTIREAALRGSPLSERQQARLLRAELRMTEIASAIVAVSAADAAQIAKLTSRPVRVLSYAGAPVPTPSTFRERRGLLFLGAIYGEDTPNGDSLRYFLRDVMPRCVGRDHLPVQIAGAGTDNAKWLAAFAGPEVEIVGPVSLLAPVFDRARAFIAPTRFSAGIPLKVIEAARHGVPVVATPLVAEQLGWRNGVELLVADSAADFAAACVALVSDAELWARVRDAALAAVRRDFDPDAFDSGVREEAAAADDSRRSAPSAFVP